MGLGFTCSALCMTGRRHGCGAAFASEGLSVSQYGVLGNLAPPGVRGN